MDNQPCIIDGRQWPTQRNAANAMRGLRVRGDEDIVAIVQAYSDLLGATSKRRNRIVSELRKATRQPSTRIGNR